MSKTLRKGFVCANYGTAPQQCGWCSKYFYQHIDVIVIVTFGGGVDL